MLTSRDLFEALRLMEREPVRDINVDDAVHSWRTPELEDSRQFESYLATNGLVRHSLGARLMSRSPAVDRPEWAKSFESKYRHTGRWYDAVGPYRFNAQQLEALPFEGFYAGFIDKFVTDLRRDLDNQLNHVSVSEQAFQAVARGLGTVLVENSVQVLIEHLHTRGDSYDQYDRYVSTVEGREELFRTFPVVARVLNDRIDDYSFAVTRIVEALDHDLFDLRAASLAAGDTSEITDLAVNLGDPHDRGQSVAILSLGQSKLVYRPRSSPEYDLYREIVTVLELDSQLPALQSLNRSTHAWVQFAEQAELSEISAQQHFFKMGMFAGLTYALGATDFHMENVIATANGPVPVDAETILGAGVDDQEKSDAFSAARGFLNDSAIGTGVLPVGVQISGSDDFEVSALAGGMTPSSASHQAIVNLGDDDINIREVAARTGRSKNLPLGTTESDLSACRNDVLAGFTESIECIRDHVQSVEGVLERFESAELRVIIRPTSLYDLTRRSLLHPRHMRSMLATEKFLLRFWKRALTDEIRGPKVQSAEVEQLLAGDIPKFSVKTFSRDVITQGRVVTRLSESPIDRCRRRIGIIQNTHLAQKQTAMVREVLDAAGTLQPVRSVREPLSEPNPTLLDGRANGLLSALSDSVLQRFASEAFVGGGQATWIGMISSEDGGSVRLAPSGTGLFDGLAGIGVGLATSFSTSGDETSRELARNAFDPVLDDLRSWSREPNGPVGAFSGASGLAYSLAVGQSVLGDESGDYRQAILDFVQTLRTKVSNDTFFDLGTGSSGAVAVLSCLLEAGIPFPSECLDALDAAAKTVTRNAQTFDGMSGVGWVANNLQRPLGGFSHGVSGIGWALSRSARWLNDREVESTCADALLFDDNYLDPQSGLWRDARPETGDERVLPVHWCHGAAGIFLARALAQQALPGTVDEASVVAAKSAVMNSPLPSSDSLCHGALGNAMCLYAVGDRDAGDSYLASALQRIVESTFKHGLGFQADSVPGLMLGYAGLLHAFAVVRSPQIPSVLSLGSEGLRFD